LTSSPHIELMADETLARGGCVVQTEIGTLDASVETRLAALQKALERT
jgi:flagellar biosynthesis/type III secretory pathway protein FliH